MSDWQAGDLAVVVGVDPADWPNAKFAGSPGDIGKVFRVVDVFPLPFCTGLLLDGLPSPHPLGFWHSASFRKVRPDEREGSADDWALLLKTHKPKVSATREEEKRG